MPPRFASLNLESGLLNTDEDSGSQLSTSRVRVNRVNTRNVPAGLPIAGRPHSEPVVSDASLPAPSHFFDKPPALSSSRVRR